MVRLWLSLTFLLSPLATLSLLSLPSLRTTLIPSLVRETQLLCSSLPTSMLNTPRFSLKLPRPSRVKSSLLPLVLLMVSRPSSPNSSVSPRICSLLLDLSSPPMPASRNSDTTTTSMLSTLRPLVLGLMTSRLVSSLLSSRVKMFLRFRTVPSKLLLARISIRLSWTPPRMFSSSTTLPGAVTARNSPLSGKSLPSTSLMLTISLLPSLMLPSMKLMVLISEAILLLSTTPRTTRLVFPTPKVVSWMTSRPILTRTPPLSRLTPSSIPSSERIQFHKIFR
mmetsp:Transcript_47911/g.64958  ORF Transcript_47911/g.64958 Transcript_47911/m.64958 type:complete len:280 (+) Transcript_47911:737-1576(+)